MDKRITKIEVDIQNNHDCTFYFENSTEPFSEREFEIRSLVRKHLEAIAYEILDYNTEVDMNVGTNT